LLQAVGDVHINPSTTSTLKMFPDYLHNSSSVHLLISYTHNI
jgi:hypothetical protein